jgi:RNA polymerase sigma factor (sigma-70 family)
MRSLDLAYAVTIHEFYPITAGRSAAAHQFDERERMTEGIAEPQVVTQPAASLLLPRIAAGDRAAVQECIDAYGGLVWSLARKLAPMPSHAEDAVQEIFIELWKSAARYDPSRCAETTWVAMIARRRLIDRRRAAQRRPAYEEISDELLERLPDPARRSDQWIETSAEAARAAQAMRQLKPTQQLVLQMAIYQGMTHAEIAEATSVPLGTVKTYVRRGLLHIRRALGVRTVDAANFAADLDNEETVAGAGKEAQA